MRIDLIFSVLPPALDGIGDHTARLAEALAAQGASVRVLTAQEETAPIPGANVERAFSLDKRRGVRQLLPAVQADPPDWLALQFNQFSYGRWGLNPYLPATIRKIKRALPQTRIAWIAHEDFVPVTSWKFAVMTLWQRWQFWRLGRSADLIFFSISPWVEKYRSWFPGTPVRHLPVGSNIPRLGLSRRDARCRIGISDETFVAGIFGSAHASRMLGRIRRAAAALHRRTQDFTLLYVGPHGETVQGAMGDLPLLDAGRLSPEDVSVHLSAMDLHLAPFTDGVSTRRGSFMAGLQHGVASVATRGDLTDRVLKEADGEALLMAPTGDAAAFERCAVALLEDDERRAALGREGRHLYESSFDWPHLAERLLKETSQRKVEARDSPSNGMRKPQPSTPQTS